MRPCFLPKTAENGGFSNTFEKSTALTLAKKRGGDGTFCILRTSGGLSYRAFVAAIVKQCG